MNYSNISISITTVLFIQGRPEISCELGGMNPIIKNDIVKREYTIFIHKRIRTKSCVTCYLLTYSTTLNKMKDHIAS